MEAACRQVESAEGCDEDHGEDSYENLHPGRRLTAKLGSQNSPFKYNGVILDAKDDTKLERRCSVFVVPKARAQEWLFSSIIGQWQVAETTKAARLIMVAVEGKQCIDDILVAKADLSPLVKCLLPLDCRTSGNVEFMTQDDGVKMRRTLDMVNSPITGPMLVEDVALFGKKSSSRKGAAKYDCFRRLFFRRNPNLIQSEMLLMRDGVSGRGRKRKFVKANTGMFEGLKVDHSYLTSPYHEGMVAAFVLIANHLEHWMASKQQIRSMIVGLGAGALPMFIHNHLPVDDIQVVELDHEVGNLAKSHFGFSEDDRMKLQIGDGLVAVQAIAAARSPSNAKHGENISDSSLHILLIDTDSGDPSNGLSCPAPGFMEDAFMLAARGALLDEGILIVNVVSSSPQHHVYYMAQLKQFFEEVYDIEVTKDVSRVLIAMPQHRSGSEMSDIKKDLCILEKAITAFASWGRGPNLTQIVRDLKQLK